VPSQPENTPPAPKPNVSGGGGGAVPSQSENTPPAPKPNVRNGGGSAVPSQPENTLPAPRPNVGNGGGSVSSAPAPCASGKIERLGGPVHPPFLISKVDPKYTREARQAGLNGTVLLSFVVNTDGWAEDFRVVKGIGMGLDEQAIEAVKQWRFAPARKTCGEASVPVKTQVRMEVNFRWFDGHPE